MDPCVHLARFMMVVTPLVAFTYFMFGFMVGKRIAARDIFKGMEQAIKELEAKNGKVRDSVPLPDNQ